MAASCVFFAAVICLIPLCFGDKPTTPPKYVINLDLPEEQRWVQVAKAYPQIPDMLKSVILQFLPADLKPLADRIGADIDKYLPSPYAGEIRGIATALNCSLGDVVIANIIYDLSAFCTSIVSQGLDGRVWHARNLDYHFTEMLRNITIFADFTRQGETVYSGVTYAGYVGLLTVQKPNAFTITADERDKGAWYENLLIGILDRNASPMSFLVRETAEQAVNFTAAVHELSQTVTEASVYFIVGGANKGEGAVITKERLGPLDIWYLNISQGRWYVLETNYDHWLPPPPGDDRRDPAIKAMNAMGNSSISVSALFGVISTEPVLNSKTTYSVVMSAGQPDLMTVWVRHVEK